MDCWINWISIQQYFNFLTVIMELPVGLKNLKKWLINIKNNDQKCFLWCHIRHIHLAKIHPERITQMIKNWLILLIMMRLNLLCQKMILVKLKWKTKFASMFFVMKTNLYNLHIESKIWKLNGFIAYIWWT